MAFMFTASYVNRERGRKGEIFGSDSIVATSRAVIKNRSCDFAKIGYSADLSCEGTDHWVLKIEEKGSS